MEPPEIAPLDGFQSDDPLSGSTEMLEEPEEMERPIEMRTSAKGKKTVPKKSVAPKESTAPEKSAEPDVDDSIDDLLGGISDTSALMELGKDYASESGSGSEGNGSDTVFETTNFIPVSPIYNRETVGLVGSGAATGFNNPESGVDGENVAKDGADDAADSGGAAAVVGAREAAFEAAVANAAENVASGSVAAGSVADAAPISGVEEDLTVTPRAVSPEGPMVTVASLLPGGEGGSVPAAVEGGAAVGQGGGLPGPGAQDLYGVVPRLLVAPDSALFNSLLVCFYDG